MIDISWIKEKSNKRKWIEVDPVETPGLSVENFQILDVLNEASADLIFKKPLLTMSARERRNPYNKNHDINNAAYVRFHATDG